MRMFTISMFLLTFLVTQTQNYIFYEFFSRGGHKSDLASSSRCWGRGTRWGRGPPDPWSAWCGRAWLLLLLVTERGGVGESLRNCATFKTLLYTILILNSTNLRIYVLDERKHALTKCYFREKLADFFVVLVLTSKGTRWVQKQMRLLQYLSSKTFSEETSLYIT